MSAVDSSRDWRKVLYQCAHSATDRNDVRVTAHLRALDVCDSALSVDSHSSRHHSQLH